MTTDLVASRCRSADDDMHATGLDDSSPRNQPKSNLRYDESTTQRFKHIERVFLGGIDTARLTRNELANLMVEDCLDRRNRGLPPNLVFSSNGQGIALAGSDSRFAAALEHADLVHADGMSVVLASRLLTSRPLPERVPTTDFFHDAAKAGQPRRLRFYMLGGREEINKRAFEEARRKYPGVEWVGRHHGFFGRGDEERVCADIVATKADVLWLALGRPHQEYFAIRNREHLAGVGWIKTCGGLFDFLAGANKRAPRWMQQICMEWFWRMMQEPQRLMWRYMKTNLQAIWRLAVCSRTYKSGSSQQAPVPSQRDPGLT
ncbi:MAG: WecB/TagA/CpsF family glycosyltransferase [Geminicoccaceae bacterium]